MDNAARGAEAIDRAVVKRRQMFARVAALGPSR
jgi:hypothetical protein